MKDEWGKCRTEADCRSLLALPDVPLEYLRFVRLPSPTGRGVGGEGKKKQKIPKDILENARKLRRSQTDAEQLLWGLLRNRSFLGKKFRRQHPVGRYILDFYCHEENLAVEIDGSQHKMKDQREYDDKRTSFLKEKGIHVIRFWSNEVLRETESVLEALYMELGNTPSPFSTPSPQTPLPGGEGLMWQAAAGTFDGWPEHLSELKVLDPCCGSGHFLVAAFLMLVPMRMELEGLSARDACDAVLRENLHGLEIDRRCVELAVFALALAAWRYPALPSPSGRGVGGEGVKPIGYRPLPGLNVACSGLSVSVAKEEWKQLAPGKQNLRIALDWMYDTFKDAPVLGSLLNPAKTDAAKIVQWEELSSVLDQALKQEQTDEQQEAAVVAQGLSKAASLLAEKYHWVITNVPYLARGKQDERLRDFCQKHYPAAKNDLATVFLDRCLELCVKGGTASIVMPQNWLFLTTYRKFREKLLKNDIWHLIARLGPGAFETISGEVVKAILITISRGFWEAANGRNKETGKHVTMELPFADSPSHPPSDSPHHICGLDVSEPRTAAEKAAALLTAEIKSVGQAKQLENPDAVVSLEEREVGFRLGNYARSLAGLDNGDTLQFRFVFWEMPLLHNGWIYQTNATKKISLFGGREHILRWEDGKGNLLNCPGARLSNIELWGSSGVYVSRMNNLPSTLCLGTSWDRNGAMIVPHDDKNLDAIWAYCSSEGFPDEVRMLNQKLSVSEATFENIPFDLDHWTKVAAEKYPNGLPKPYSDDPTQWIFHGHPCGSVIWNEETKILENGPLRTDASVLQVAVARLLGYRWPAEIALTPDPSPSGRGENCVIPDLSPGGRGENRLMSDPSRKTIGENRVIPDPSPKGRGENHVPLPLGEGGRRPGEGEMELADEQRAWVTKCDALLKYVDEDGIVCISSVRGEEPAANRLRELLSAAFGPDWSPAREQELIKATGVNAASLDDWLHDHFFEQHCKLFHHRPFIWHIWDGRRRDGFHALVNYHKLAEGNGKGRQLLESLTYSYLGDWITRQKDGVKQGEGGAEDRLASALELQKRLISIIEGEPPFDIFVRWKPIEEQPIGWEPDINDGVRLNIRPFMAQDIPGGRKGAGILRWKPNIKWNKDRGKDVASAPWFLLFEGDRINDHHLSLEEKGKARERMKAEG